MEKTLWQVLCCVSLAGQLLTSTAWAKVVRYELTVTNQKINLSGNREVDFALLINGTYPGPILEFQEGDEAEILVTNLVPKQDLSMHWHGILLPPDMDGVAYVTNPPIKTGKSLLFRFPIKQSGTYWYHSHTGVQEQKGVLGAIVIHPKKSRLKFDREIVLVLSDWTDENPDQVLRNLKKDGDYYLYKKGTLRSIGGALQAGKLSTYLHGEWTRMGAMDLSDVGYDRFLVNGKPEISFSDLKRGDRLRLRIVNAAASTYFQLTSHDPLEIISADGQDVVPVKGSPVLMGMAETYDLSLTVPARGRVELRATAQDGTGRVSAWFGQGEPLAATALPPVDLYAGMVMPLSAEPMSMAEHHHHEMAMAPSAAGVDQLSSPQSTAPPPGAKIKEIKVTLGGDMARYVWTMNGKTMQQESTLWVDHGDVIRYTLVNETMMHHPLHLHGHFFRVLNQFGDKSPLKHTVDVPPHGSRTIEFFANEPGEWMFHCHNLYHMKSGMERVVRYRNFVPSSEMVRWQNQDPHHHEHWYTTGKLEAATNHAALFFRASTSQNQVEVRAESTNQDTRAFSLTRHWDFEGDLFYRRWMNRFLNLVVGGTSYENTESVVVGAGYLLPLLIESNWLVNNEGHFRLDLHKRLQWSRDVFSDLEFTWRPDQGGHETDFELSLMYGPSWQWAAGLMMTNSSQGVGAFFRF